MKKILSIFALFSCLSSFSQADLHIIEDCTDLSGKCYIYASHTFVIANAEKNKGFKIDADFRRNKDTQALEVTGFLCKLVNIGTCSEKNELILLFEDDSKFTIYSWNKWNCDGDAWYYLSKSQVETLATKKLVKAQMKNGYSFESYMNNVDAENQDYFIRLIGDANQNKVELQK
jgi:hypothetical protein